MESLFHDKTSQENGKRLLTIDQFRLKKRYNELFYGVLCSIIQIYNKGVKEEIEKNNIYLSKEDGILLANISDNLVERYYEYKKLFNDLMRGQNAILHNSDSDFYQINKYYFQEKPIEDRALSVKNYQSGYLLNKSTISISDEDKYTSNSCFQKENKSYNNGCPTSEMNSKLSFKSLSYFNGIFFDSETIESLFKITDLNLNNDERAKSIITFLPRILFYMKEDMKKIQTVQPTNKFNGYNEIDCAFIVKEKEYADSQKNIITFFKDLYTNEELELCGVKNICDITLQNNDVVFLEVKSIFNQYKKEEIEKNKIKSNKILQFVENAKLFIKFYLKLNLIEPNQRIVLIYLYSNYMYFDLDEEKKNINEAKEAIPKGLNIILEITYYKLYMKMMNPYERIINLRNLNHRLDNLEQQINNNQIEINNHQKEINNHEKEINNHEQEINNQQIKLEKQKEDFQERMIKSDDKLGRIELQIKKLIEEINYLKRNQKESVNNKLSESNKDVKNNNNENKGNEQDNNVKNKINSITSVENIEITFTKK